MYYPGAQVAIDAKKLKVFFKASLSVLTVTREVAIDIASLAILGESLEKEECSGGVERVIVKARKECSEILSILADNGPANRAESVQKLLERDQTGQIFSFPYHPQTNGHLEGPFGQLERNVGKIEIDDTSSETLAASIVDVIVRIYVHFHNYSPRRRLDGLSPIEYLRSYCPKPQEREAARADLARHTERSEALRREPSRLQDPLFRARVERTLQQHRFGGSIETSHKALVRYDDGVIESASAAFFVQSHRSGFDERKRTFAYFMAIVRNKQKELDEARLRSEIGRQKSARVIAESERTQKRIQAEALEEKRLLGVDPERVILQNVELLLRGKLRFLKDRSIEGLRHGLEALRKLDRATAGTRDRIAATIRSWGAYGERLKEEALALFTLEYERHAL